MANDDFSKLKKKYVNFASPFFEIKINEKNIDKAFLLGAISVNLTAKYEASVCQFDIKNAFKMDGNSKIKIKDDLSKLVKLGNKVEIYLGYTQGGAVHVFSGYIDQIYVDYDKDDGITYSVECLDGKGIMMNSHKSEAKVGIEKYSEAAESVLKKYTSVLKISSSDFAKTDEKTLNIIEQYNESDYNFVVRMAEKLNYCFFIEKGEVIFKPFEKLSKTTIFNFNINEYMLSFNFRSSLKDVVSSVIVRSNDEKDETKFFEGKATNFESIVDSTKGSAKISSLINENVVKTFVDMSVDSENRAKEIAQGKLNEISYGIFNGTIKTVGIPEIFPGGVVLLEGFGESLDRKYFLSKVYHKIENNTFTTVCEVEVNKE